MTTGPAPPTTTAYARYLTEYASAWPVNPPGESCWLCGARHRTWQTVARCYYQRADHIDGDGEWVAVDEHRVVSRRVHLHLHATPEEAHRWIEAKGHCSGTHQSFRVVRMGAWLGLGPVRRRR